MGFGFNFYLCIASVPGMFDIASCMIICEPSNCQVIVLCCSPLCRIGCVALLYGGACIDNTTLIWSLGASFSQRRSCKKFVVVWAPVAMWYNDPMTFSKPAMEEINASPPTHCEHISRTQSINKNVWDGRAPTQWQHFNENVFSGWAETAKGNLHLFLP